MQWFACIWGILTVLVLFWKFRKYVTGWEYLAVLAVPLMLCPLTGKVVQQGLASAQEYWGGWAVRVYHQDDWTEEYTVTVTDYDSKGNAKGSHTETRTTYHPDIWQLTDSNEIEVNIGSGTYQDAVSKWGNEKRRTNIHSDAELGHNGGEQWCDWNGDLKDLLPVTTIHTYENRVRVSDSIFRYPDVDPKQYGLYEYPKIGEYYAPAVLGYNGPDYPQVERLFDLINAQLGASKQVRTMLLVFQDPKQPLQAGIQQEAYWQGGNKNELIVCVGLRADHTVGWVHVFSWTPNKVLVANIEGYVSDQKGRFNPVDLATWLRPQIASEWKRKQFSDFAYLTISLPVGWLIFIHVLTILACSGVGMLVISNDFDAPDVNSPRVRLRR